MMEDTAAEIHRIGHRKFVGGDGPYWDRVGELQLKFLTDQGLKPSDIFIDAGCGSLRGGIRFVDYLDPGHYLGLDKHIELIAYGIACELTVKRFREKRPQFAISDRFEFEKFNVAPTFGLAQSLFSHLTGDDISLCLANLRERAAPGCRFFATYHSRAEEFANPAASHSHDFFAYTPAQMKAFGEQAGWQANPIGAWGHPRDQHIVEYRNAAA